MVLDLKFNNGVVVDGTGRNRFKTDIGIKDGLIAEIGDLKKLNAVKEYDIAGLIIAPGFIDIHSHSEISTLINPEASGKAYQGVTTEVVGNCGSSAAPALKKAIASVKRNLSKYGLNLNWGNLKEYFEEIKSKGSALNIASLIGHGLLRKAVMGDKTGEPTSDELKEMKQLLLDAMEDGAYGLSTGLIYPPSSYATTEELIELAKVVADYEGIYATHLRDEGDNLISAVQEAIEIGKKAKVSVQISHHKAIGKRNWGKVEETLDMIREANQFGLDINCDLYPYLATSTGLAALLPSEIKKGGREQVLERLKDKRIVCQIKDYWQNERRGKESWDKIFIAEVNKAVNKNWEGKNIEEIAEEWGKMPAEVVIELLIMEDLDINMIKFSISPNDLEEVLKCPYSMIASDALTRAKSGILSQGKPHPRAYGTFPRAIKKFVLKEGVITLEEAIKKMSYFPAKKLGLSDRGRIISGLAADLVVFDLKKIRDQATYQSPHQYSEGVKYLLVNGHFVIKDYEQTSALSGQVLIKDKKDS
jgi:N-acyl-D-amino-acid deacylase